MSRHPLPKRMVPQFGPVSALVLAWILHGCGVEVGNPSEPTPTQPKDSFQPALPGSSSVPIDSIDTVEPVEPVKFNIRSLVENQHDEAVATLLDFVFEEDDEPVLATTGSRNCGLQADGSIVLNHQETKQGTRASGMGPDATTITESFSRMYGSSMQSPDMSLACDTTMKMSKLNWSSLNTLVIDGSLERSNNRLVVMNPSQEFVRESSLKSSGSHQSMISKVSFSSTEGLKLKRTLTFDTNMEITARSATAAAKSLNAHIQTAAEDPLVVSEAYDAELEMDALKIVSGTVSSVKADDGLTVILRYNNVVLNVEGTCRPVSGEIKGEVRSTGNPNQVQETFSIAFARNESVILFADGTGSRLEFEPCRMGSDDDDDDDGMAGKKSGNTAGG